VKLRLEKRDQITKDALIEHNFSFHDIFQEIPIKVHNITSPNLRENTHTHRERVCVHSTFDMKLRESKELKDYILFCFVVVRLDSDF
jgi:hypothetical protein